MEIKIVEYDPSLSATLAKMWNDSKDDWGGGDDTKTPGQVHGRITGSSIMHHYVAMAGEEAVGYCSLGRYFADADALYIELLGVRPDYQGKKVGKALVLKCVERTIELGYPRLDIHTWPGNTAAMPLYKKCGYLWEDRADSTHLVNFIPEILGTEMFQPFFAKADWYADSTRTWDVERDGVKMNKFEVFGYTWAKDGETLAVGYERTGRRMRLIETNDYKIELMADNHELAFGLEYGCKFTVSNKSGAPLHVKINGCEDKNIRFDYTLDTQVEGTQEFEGRFIVGEVTTVQDKWKVHPCLLADVEINGQKVTMGLGINPKFPLIAKVTSENVVHQPGMTADCFINITSSLLQDATVTFSFPKNTVGEVENGSFIVQIPAEGKKAVPIRMKHLEAGYDPAVTSYEIKMADGTAFSFKKPLHLNAQSLTHAFSGENDTEHFIYNGPWRVQLRKSDNEAGLRHLTNSELSQGWFEPPKFGKPYDDEFNLAAPVVTSFVRGTDMIMEAAFVSEKFPGMVATMVFTLNAAGVVTRHYRVENCGATTREMFLNDAYWLALGAHTVFKYNGQFTQNHDAQNPNGPFEGIDALDTELFEENWLFEAAPGGGRGFCWSPNIKPEMRWGNYAIFENDLGTLNPGDTMETPAVVLAYGLFNNFGDFRNYAMQLWETESHVPTRRVEICVNSHNPFLSSVMGEEEVNRSVTLDILNQRETTLDGEINVMSDWFDTQTIMNESDCDDNDAGDDNDDDDEATTKECNFNLPMQRAHLAPDGIVQLKVNMNLSTYTKSSDRALFAPTGEVNKKREDNSLVVSNDKITFCVDPEYGPVCYSMTTPDGTEWLKHQHPEHKPFAWWSPFLGGIRLIPSHMNNTLLLKQKITADFANVTDNFGNEWQGICVTLDVVDDDEIKGALLETYYMTLPGLPMVCTFFRCTNNTGEYHKKTHELDAFLRPCEEGDEYTVTCLNKNGEVYNLRFGAGADMSEEFVGMAKLSSKRAQNLYIFHGNKNNGKTNEIAGDSKMQSAMSVYMETHAAPDATFTSSPMFFLVTEADIPLNAMDDLERVKFA
ncbi:MAG: GNAT family N-acetyltransferase [Defluviitaleaceae bacterium]|nr:GNAT family N-acetyltransferase [Defluviitaleaceae bacterium]